LQFFSGARIDRSRGEYMSINLFKDQATPIEKQRFTWKEIVQNPISKLNDDAFSRIRIIMMNGIEQEALRFGHACARMNKQLQLPLAKIRRIDQHQASMISGLLGSDHSPLELTVGYEQAAIEVTAAVAQVEPDPYLAQVYRFGLLEDFDHLYRYSALMDRIEGKDANCILQNYTDIMPGRPTLFEHRDPEDELRHHYEKSKAGVLTKFHALTIMSGEQQTYNFYLNIGPMFSDPMARQLYAEITSIKEQHVTQYESIIDPNESWMEKWLIHEANEVYNYYSCMAYEDNPRLKAIWERFLDYELGQLQAVMEIFKSTEKRDPAEILPEKLPNPIEYKGQRDFIRKVLFEEVDMRTKEKNFIASPADESEATRHYREYLNSEGCPAEIISGGYIWKPGTELAQSSLTIQ
jgi:hypothetical protein